MMVLRFAVAFFLLVHGGRAVGGISFHGPATGSFLLPSKPPRPTELPVTVNDEQPPPLRLPRPDDLQALLCRVPYVAHVGVWIWTSGLAILGLAGFDVSAGAACVGAGVGVLNLVAFCLRTPEKPPTPQSLVRNSLRAPYDPPPNATWTGNPSMEEEVRTFVKRNPMDTTLVLVDTTGKVKRNLLDGLFRGQVHVVAPVLDELSLKKGLCEFFGLTDTKGLPVLANLIKKGIHLPGKPVMPAKIVVEVPSRARTQDAVTILSDASALKQVAGQNVVTIVTVDDSKAVEKARPSLRSALQVLS